MKLEKKSYFLKSEIEQVANDNNISPLFAELLLQIGINTPEAIQKYLYGTIRDLTPFSSYKGCTEIANRLKIAIENKESIVVYGDYDCDGISASAIYYLSLKKAGVNVHIFIPSRHEDGYGVKDYTIDNIIEKYHPDIILTADCGITSVEEVKHARERGVEMIITDHHEPRVTAPECLYMDPCYTPSLTQLCATGVAFTVIRALFGDKEAFLYLDICAIATVADIVPLTGDNRIIVKEGIKIIRQGKARKGIKLLLNYAKCDFRTFNASDISFKIAPRLNAAGRINSAMDALKVLIDDDETELSLYCDNICTQNSERQQLAASVYKEAMKMLKDYDFGKYKLIMIKGDWNPGIVGNVCSKIVEFFYLPTILLCNKGDELTGSSRSIEGVNIHQLLEENNSKLLSYGGHAMAAGLSMKSKDFEEVREQFNQYISQIQPSVFHKKKEYNIAVPMREITMAEYQEISMMEPYGEGNLSPVFLDDEPTYHFKRSSIKSPIIKGKTKIGEIVFFNGLSQLQLLTEKNKYSILYQLEKNSFNGAENPQFNIKHVTFNQISADTMLSTESFFSLFLKENEKKSKKSKSQNPILYVYFSAEKYNDNISQNGHNLIIKNGNVEPVDTDVIFPDIDFPFEYFGTVVFCDYYHPILTNYLIENGIHVITNSKDRFPLNYDISFLREVYLFFKNKTIFTERFNCFSDYAQEFCQTNGKTGEEFVSASYVLQELKLINLNESGCLVISNQKVDMNLSIIMKYINGEL